MGRKEKFTAEEMVMALRATKGMVYIAAERLGCEPRTVYNYAERYALVKDEIAKQDGVVDDTAELKLIQAIHNGEPWAIKYRLSTKGKSRGYIERSEIDHRMKDVSQLSDDELHAIVEAKSSS